MLPLITGVGPITSLKAVIVLKDSFVFILVKTIDSALNNWIVASYCDCIFVGVNPSIVC